MVWSGNNPELTPIYNRNLQPQQPKKQQKTELPTTSSQRYLLSWSTTREQRSILATFPRRNRSQNNKDERNDIETTLKPLWNHLETTPSTRCPLRGPGPKQKYTKIDFPWGSTVAKRAEPTYIAKTESNPELSNVCFFSHLPLFQYLCRQSHGQSVVWSGNNPELTPTFATTTIFAAAILKKNTEKPNFQPPLPNVLLIIIPETKPTETLLKEINMFINITCLEGPPKPDWNSLKPLWNRPRSPKHAHVVVFFKDALRISPPLSQTG